MKRGEIIKQRRMELGLSIRALAKKAGVSNPYICQIEKGDRSFSIDVLLKLSKALNISIDRLLLIEKPKLEEKPQIDRIEEKINKLV
jgi:transcriptional regulator with XRE-family HTH domain